MQYPEESEEKDQGLVDVPSRNPFRLYAHQGPYFMCYLHPRARPVIGAEARSFTELILRRSDLQQLRTYDKSARGFILLTVFGPINEHVIQNIRESVMSSFLHRP